MAGKYLSGNIGVRYLVAACACWRCGRGHLSHTVTQQVVALSNYSQLLSLSLSLLSTSLGGSASDEYWTPHTPYQRGLWSTLVSLFCGVEVTFLLIFKSYYLYVNKVVKNHYVVISSMTVLIVSDITRPAGGDWLRTNTDQRWRSSLAVAVSKWRQEIIRRLGSLEF